MTIGLAALIAPHTRADFDRAGAAELLVVHGLTDTIASSAITASPHDARKLFANGMSLLFDDAHELSPVLGAWLEALRGDLGLSALTQSRCLMYATPRGGGTAPHFDQNVNLVLQLHGEKTWWLAPNRHVDAPMTRHTMGLPLDHELGTYATQPLPSAMPADRRAVVLRPGSLLVVPRGVWHATEAATDALALNFTFTAPTWIDVFSAALRGQLARSRAWRETAMPAAPADFERLLRALALDAPTWNAADILATTEQE